MTISANIYSTDKISADPNHNGDVHWAVVHFVGPRGEFDVCAFFETAELADAYAAAINSVSAVKPLVMPGFDHNAIGQDDPEQ